VLGGVTAVAFTLHLAAPCTTERATVGATGLHAVIVHHTLRTRVTRPLVDHLGHGAHSEAGVVVLVAVCAADGHEDQGTYAAVRRTPSVHAPFAVFTVAVHAALGVVHANTPTTTIRVIKGALTGAAFTQDVDLFTLSSFTQVADTGVLGVGTPGAVTIHLTFLLDADSGAVGVRRRGTIGIGHTRLGRHTLDEAHAGHTGGRASVRCGTIGILFTHHHPWHTSAAALGEEGLLLGRTAQG